MKFKKEGFLTFLICFALIFSLCGTSVFASTDSTGKTTKYSIEGKNATITILEDTKDIKKVSVEADGQKSVVTLNKKTGIASSETTDKNGKITKLNIDTNKSKSTPQGSLNSTKTITKSSLNVIASNGDGWWNYNYTIFKVGSGRSWYTRIKNYNTYKNTTETTSNSSTLNSFRSSVDSLVKNEVACAAAGGTAIASAIAGAIGGLASVGLATVVGIVVALGGSFTAAYYGYSAWQDSRSATSYFNEL